MRQYFGVARKTPVVPGLVLEPLVIFVPLALVLPQRLDAIGALVFVEVAAREHQASGLNAVLHAQVRHNSAPQPVAN
jgi:hypothetical protein